MDQVFKAALEKLSAARSLNRATIFSCTEYFSDFFDQSKDTRPFVQYFQERNVLAVETVANRTQYVYFSLPQTQLRAWGYRGFRRGDRLVISFTTSAPGANDITSAKANIFGWEPP